MNTARLPEPQREYRFHDTRLWRFDFAWPTFMAGVEVEGGTWVHGRHNRGKQFEADCYKYNAAVMAGWSILRFTTDMVNNGEALDAVEHLLKLKGWSN